MTNEQMVEAAYQDTYNKNTALLLNAKKLARHISQSTGKQKVKVIMETELYARDFKVHYFFNYGPYDRFNAWLLDMCDNFPIDGKTTGRIDDRHFVYEEDFNGNKVKVEVFGEFDGYLPADY